MKSQSGLTFLNNGETLDFTGFVASNGVGSVQCDWMEGQSRLTNFQWRWTKWIVLCEKC